MSSLPNADELSGFAPGVVLIGEGQPADRIWTREEFVSICNLMRNGNLPTNFYMFTVIQTASPDS